MSARRKVTDEDRQSVRRRALSLLAADRIDELVAEMSDRYVEGNLFPGDVLIGLATDALSVAAPTCDRSILASGIRERYLPEHEFSGNTAHQKSWAVLKVVAMTYAGVAPDLVEEVGWWRVNDLWFYATAAFVIYARAAAEHASRSVRDLCEEIARARGIDLDDPPEVSPHDV